MTHITPENIGAGLLGIIIVFLLRLQAAMRKKSKVPFSRGKWVSENWIDSFLGAIGTFCGIYFMDEIGSLLGITIQEGMGELAHSFLCGLNGQFIISKIKTAIKPN